MSIPPVPEKHIGIPVYRMVDNKNGDLPIYIRTFSMGKATYVLHCHEPIQVNYVLRGSPVHIINNTAYKLVKGDIFIIPPYVPHKLENNSDSQSEMIELEFLPEFIFGNRATIENIKSIFDFAYIEPFLVSECEVKPRLNLTGKAQADVEAMFFNLLDEYREKKSNFLLAMKAIVLNLLVYAGRCFEQDIKDSESKQVFDRHREAITNAIDYIDKTYTEDLTIEAASRVAMLSQSYFSYLFKTMTGKTFTEYLNEMRILHAMQLLKETGKRIVDICFESGFNNVNHFNRTFKSYSGISPMQYRNANKA
ncbi:MAG: AraC family transcriptional regulator [Clostridiales bacterium]|nr:AraC family transcriptional regulator [Clostridiales bacterium]